MANRTALGIIRAFSELMDEGDFQKISVDMIMEKAQVSRSTFYRHFKDKYDVMNAGYKRVFDHYASPEQSRDYRELCYNMFSFVREHRRMVRRALETQGYNSFSNFVSSYAYDTAEKITRQNRGGEGFTAAEVLQVDVFCNGICAVFRNMVSRGYALDAAAAADALFEMMPESLKHYWWREA